MTRLSDVMTVGYRVDVEEVQRLADRLETVNKLLRRNKENHEKESKGILGFMRSARGAFLALSGAIGLTVGAFTASILKSSGILGTVGALIEAIGASITIAFMPQILAFHGWVAGVFIPALLEWGNASQDAQGRLRGLLGLLKDLTRPAWVIPIEYVAENRDDIKDFLAQGAQQTWNFTLDLVRSGNWVTLAGQLGQAVVQGLLVALSDLFGGSNDIAPQNDLQGNYNRLGGDTQQMPGGPRGDDPNDFSNYAAHGGIFGGMGQTTTAFNDAPLGQHSGQVTSLDRLPELTQTQSMAYGGNKIKIRVNDASGFRDAHRNGYASLIAGGI